MDHGCGVDRPPVAFSRLEPDALRRLNRSLIHTVTEAPYNSQHAQIPGGPEKNTQDDLTFNVQPASLSWINGVRF